MNTRVISITGTIINSETMTDIIELHIQLDPKLIKEHPYPDSFIRSELKPYIDQIKKQLDL